MNYLTSVPTAKEIRNFSNTCTITKSFQWINDIDTEFIMFEGDKFMAFTNAHVRNLTFEKLVRMGFDRPQRAFFSEQEEAHWQGVRADMEDPNQHGRVMMQSIVNGDGGGTYVWDYNKQQIVLKSELS